MANPRQLVRTVAAALGLPEATLVLHDRNLADAGLRTKIGRGRSAARVTPRDAAHLITAVLASGLVKESVQTVQRYALARRDPRRSSEKPFAETGIAQLAALPDDHTFIDAVEAVIASCIDGTLTQNGRGGRDNASQQLPRIEIAAHTPGTLGNVRIAGLKNGATANVTYVLRDPLEVKSTQVSISAEN